MLSEKNQYVQVKAHFIYLDKEVQAVVINPGDHQGRSWMVFIDNQAWPDYFIVEARSPTMAEDVFVSSEYGKDARLTTEDLEERSPDAVHWTSDGIPYESEGIMVNGADDEQIPWLCKYHATGLPAAGIDPPDLANYTTEDCEICGARCYTLQDECAACSEACLRELQKVYDW